MTASDFPAWAQQQLEAIEHALSQWVPPEAPARLGEAMRYAVLRSVGNGSAFPRGNVGRRLRRAAHLSLVGATLLIDLHLAGGDAATLATPPLELPALPAKVAVRATSEVDGVTGAAEAAGADRPGAGGRTARRRNLAR